MDRRFGAVLHSLILVLCAASLASGQAVVDPTFVEFEPSPDHFATLSSGAAAVSRYDLEVYEAGTVVPVQVLNLGKPALGANGKIQVTFLPSWPSPGVLYEARINTIGPGGASDSVSSNEFSFTGNCNYVLDQTYFRLGIAGGSASINILTGARCSWQAVSAESWVSVSNGSASGSGTVSLSIAPNVTATLRSAAVTIAGQVVTIEQSAAPCPGIAAIAQLSLTSASQNASIGVSAAAGCAWTATSSASWLTVTPANGAGTGGITYAAGANTTTQSRTATIKLAKTVITVTQAPGQAATKAPPATKGDFDGDGKTDIVVWRPSSGVWHEVKSSNGTAVGRQWGMGYSPYDDVPVPADYDGDSKTDIAVWRAATGVWYIVQSSTGTVVSRQWGAPGEKPVPGDYDGDRKTDVAVWNPATGIWKVVRSSTGTTFSTTGGAAHAANNDVPVPGDYDYDGKADIAIWRASTGVWYVTRSSDAVVSTRQWGAGYAPYNDLPVPADYDGDHKIDIAVWRAATGTWYVIRSSDGVIGARQWGAGYAPYNDVPAPGDYDGDSKTDVAVWRASTGTWYIVRSSNSSVVSLQWGASTDQPVPQL